MDRYCVRWANGFWRLFDTFAYSTAELLHTEKDARALCAQANEWQARGGEAR